jgi:hypothetical protein
MTADDYMETIVQYMVALSGDLSEMSASEKELLFKSRARKHNPPIPEHQIQNFWEKNRYRV